jgi:hypothetical protein
MLITSGQAIENYASGFRRGVEPVNVVSLVSYCDVLNS